MAEDDLLPPITAYEESLAALTPVVQQTATDVVGAAMVPSAADVLGSATTARGRGGSAPPRGAEAQIQEVHPDGSVTYIPKGRLEPTTLPPYMVGPGIRNLLARQGFSYPEAAITRGSRGRIVETGADPAEQLVEQPRPADIFGIQERASEQAAAKDQELAALTEADFAAATAPAAQAAAPTVAAQQDPNIEALVQASMGILTSPGQQPSRQSMLLLQQAVGNIGAANQAVDAARQARVEAFQGQQQAAVMSAVAQGTAAQRAAEIIRDRYAEEEGTAQEAIQDVDRRLQGYEADLAGIRDKTVEPNRLFHSMATADKVAFVFTAMLDGIMRGRGQPTNFWPQINAMLDRDIQAQSDSLSRQERSMDDSLKALKISRANFSDKVAQSHSAKAAELEGLVSIVEGLKARAAGADAVAILDGQIAQIREMQGLEAQAAAQAEYQAQLKARRRGMSMERRIKQAKGLTDIAKTIQTLRKQGEAGGVDPKRLTELSKMQNDTVMASQSLNRLTKLVEKHGVPGNLARLAAGGDITRLAVPEETKVTLRAFDQAIAMYIKAVSGAQATEQEHKRIKDSILGGVTSASEFTKNLNGVTELFEAKQKNILAGFTQAERAESARQAAQVEEEFQTTTLPEGQ